MWAEYFSRVETYELGPDQFTSPLAMTDAAESVAVAAAAADTDNAALINEKCPECGNPQVQFRTLQLRSADEGTTVFYTCPKCNYKWSTNN